MSLPESPENEPPEQYEWRRMCHETGHAVAAVRLGVPFISVEVCDDGSGKLDTPESPTANRERQWSKDELSRWQRLYAAGAAAELLIFGNCKDRASSMDRCISFELECARVGQPLWSARWDEDVYAAKDVLDRESIELVAAELQQKRKLTPERVHELLGLQCPWV